MEYLLKENKSKKIWTITQIEDYTHKQQSSKSLLSYFDSIKEWKKKFKMECGMITDVQFFFYLISFGALCGVFPPACCASASTL